MTTLENAMRTLPPLIALLICAGCSGPADQADDAATGDTTAEQAVIEGAAATGTAEANTADSVSEATQEDGQRPQFAGTAWRTNGEDGAVFSTYLDEDGTYRDMKNGQPLQQGSWEALEGDRICFTPDAEDRSGECWETEVPDANGTMRATSDKGRTIELRRIAYVAPGEGE